MNCEWWLSICSNLTDFERWTFMTMALERDKPQALNSAKSKLSDSHRSPGPTFE
jgi:hypothetical protein